MKKRDYNSIREKKEFIEGMVRLLTIFVAITCLFLGCSSKEERMGFIDDQSALLTEQERDHIVELDRKLLKELNIYMKVVVLREGSLDIDRKSVELFQKYALGKKGFLFLVDPAKKQIRFKIGNELGLIFPDGLIEYIEHRQMTPFFQANKVGPGIKTTIELFVSRAILIGKERQPEAVKDLMNEIKENLELLENAIYNYMVVNSEYGVRWPKRLDDLVPEYLDKIPGSIGGKWVYDSTSGKICNSIFPEINTKRVRLNIAPMLKKEKENQIKGNLGTLRSGITAYYALNEKFPDRLEDLVPQIVPQIPSPIDGFWEYDPKNGMVGHSLDPKW